MFYKKLLSKGERKTKAHVCGYVNTDSTKNFVRENQVGGAPGVQSMGYTTVRDRTWPHRFLVV